jgi:hypothetical protein
MTKRPWTSSMLKNPHHQYTIRIWRKYEIRLNPPHVLHQRKALRNILGADDNIEPEREFIREITLGIDVVVGPVVLDALSLCSDKVKAQTSAPRALAKRTS